MKICPNCKAQVDDNSSFCTYCGSNIAAVSAQQAGAPVQMMPQSAAVAPQKPQKAPKPPKPPKAPKPPKQKKPGSGSKVPVVILSILTAVLAIGLIGTIIYYEHECNLIIAKYREQKQTLTSVQSDLTSANATIEDQESTIKSLEEENQTLKDSNDSFDLQAAQAEAREQLLYTHLKGANTSNGKVSTKSIVYAVKKGETAKVDVSWKANECYMGPEDETIISAKWSGDDVEVTGKKEGVSYLEFSSDAYGLKDSFKVVVICYE